MGKVEMVEMDDGTNKPVLFFQNAKSGLVLNKINSNTIMNMYGPETDAWFGQKITLYPDQTDFAGKRVPCIRVKMEYNVQQNPAGLQPSTVAAGGAPVGPSHTALAAEGYDVSDMPSSENLAVGLDDNIPF